MRPVTYSLTTSVDGYVAGPDGDLDWGAPDEELFVFATEEVRRVDVHLMGRRLYETMLYWETAAQEPGQTALELEFADLWKALPKVVFSRTLSEVEGSNTRLATGSLAEEIERLRAEPGAGSIAIGGATPAAEAIELGLVDEFRRRVHPVLLGAGTPYFPHRGTKVELELVECRSFACGVAFLHHRVVR